MRLRRAPNVRVALACARRGPPAVPKTPALDPDRFTPAAPYRKLIKQIRCWPPFQVLHVEWLWIIPASDAPDLLAKLRLTREDCWKVRGMSSGEISSPTNGGGYIGELVGVPVIILELDNPDLHEANINLLLTLSSTRTYRTCQLKQEREEAGEVLRQYKPDNASYSPQVYDEFGRPLENGVSSYTKVLARFQEQQIQNLPENRLKRIEQQLAKMVAANNAEREALLRQVELLREQLAEQINRHREANR